MSKFLFLYIISVTISFLLGVYLEEIKMVLGSIIGSGLGIGGLSLYGIFKKT